MLKNDGNLFMRHRTSQLAVHVLFHTTTFIAPFTIMLLYSWRINYHFTYFLCSIVGGLIDTLRIFNTIKNRRGYFHLSCTITLKKK